MSIERKYFDTTKNGEEVFVYKMQNVHGMEVSVIDFGAVLQKLYVADKEGKMRDVVLGFDEAEGYENNAPGFGATVGRNGNRIGKGRFILNGKSYQLKTNDGENNLHSGGESYHFRMWQAQVKEEETERSR